MTLSHRITKKLNKMNLEKGYLYHIYNQGNNGRKIFFNKGNYLYFIEKIKTYIKPYTDILAWCLMPNHFHLMVLIKDVELPIESDTMTQSHLITKTRTLNNSIAIMLRSYTRAINKQENFKGSLFKAHTKAECINCFKGNALSFITEKQYPQACFNYIHQNPVKAKLVTNEIDYEFSSAKDYAGLRNNKLINKTVAFEYVDYKIIGQSVNQSETLI